MLDDALDVVLVVLVDGGLALDVVDDERCGVLQDLFVLVREHHVRLARRRRTRAVAALLADSALLRALLLTLKQNAQGQMLEKSLVQQ